MFASDSIVALVDMTEVV